MPEVDVNYVAVLVAAIINMAVGFVWYSRGVMGNSWMKLTGKKMEAGEGANLAYVLTMAGSLLLAYVLAHFVDYAAASTAFQGMLVGFWAWVGFVLPTMGTNALFEGKPSKLTAINTGYPLVALLLMGWILATWV